MLSYINVISINTINNFSMPSYHIKKVIKDTSVKCAVAAVPGAFVGH